MALGWFAAKRFELLLDVQDRDAQLFLAVTRFGTAAMDQERGENHHREQLQELRLPVLERGLEPIPDVPGAAEQLRGLVMAVLVGGERYPAEKRVPDPGSEEQSGEHDAQGVIANKLCHLAPSRCECCLGRYARRVPTPPRERP